MTGLDVPLLAIGVDSAPRVLTGHGDLLRGLGSEPLDDYEGEESRFAIYTVKPDYRALRQLAEGTYDAALYRRRIAETSRDGIGGCLATLREEGDLTDDSRVGILDRLDRVWLVNPWARGDLR